MFKKIFFVFLCIALLCCSSSWSSNPRADVMLKHIRSKKENTNFVRYLSAPATVDTDEDEDDYQFYPVILEISQTENADEILAGLEAIVFYSRDNLYLTCIPIDKIDELPTRKDIADYQLSNVASKSLDVARAVSGVNQVHSLLSAIEGEKNSESKVVTGICDIGFDPRHPAFKNCLKKWVIYDEFRGKRNEFIGYDKIVAEGPVSDNVNETHATHVGNILSGKSGSSPYYGSAPNADFVATVSRLSDVGLCAGIEDIIAYAKSQGKRAVVNLSIASFTGPHDGTDLVGRYLSALSHDAVICFSSGNYGSSNVSLSFSLDECPEEVGSTFLDVASWAGFEVYGQTDLWSEDEKPFEFRIVIWDMEKSEIKYVSDWMGAAESEGEYHLDLSQTPWFTAGDIWASWGISDANNRFNVALEYDYENDTPDGANNWTRYFTGFYIRKVVADTKVYVYSDGSYSILRSSGMTNAFAGTGQQSINNLATAPGLIAVGAWYSRTDVPDTRTGTMHWSDHLNTVASWSSYGTTVDGRSLPHFSAPGAPIVSAMSKPYAEIDRVSEHPTSLAMDQNGEIYFAMQGTSMSSPFATGIIALWLEADPDLSVNDIIDIASSTSNRDFVDIDNPRWGAGSIDALKGFEAIQTRLGVADVSTDSSVKPTVKKIGDTIVVEWPGVANPTVEIFDLVGRQIANVGGNYASPMIVKVTNPANSVTYTFKMR